MIKASKVISIISESFTDTEKMQVRKGFEALFKYFLHHSMFEGSPENTTSYVSRNIRHNIVGAGFACLPTDSQYAAVEFSEVLCLIEHLFTVITYYSRDEIPGMSVWVQDKDKGKEIFCDKVNTLFQGSGYLLDENGKFVVISESELLKGILDADITENYQKIIFEASDLHRAGHTVEASNKLGTILEKFRKGALGKNNGLNGDCEDLMEIINTYSFRHGHRAKNQQKEVDSAILKDWVFYSLLNVVVTYIRLEKEST